MASDAKWVEIGRIGRPFGLRGWVHFESWTEPPAAALAYRNLRLQGRPGAAGVRVAELREHGRSFVVRFEGVETVEAAATLTSATVEVPRAELPAPAAGEHYQADLLGLRVRNLEGAELGVLDHIVEAPGNPVMVVVGAREHWVPLTPRHLHRVEAEAGVIWVDWPDDF
jgi:16S rRNA processing protein RimM